MTIIVTMKDGTHRAYDGVINIRHNGHLGSKLEITYFSSNSSRQLAELEMNKVKGFKYGNPTAE